MVLSINTRSRRLGPSGRKPPPNQLAVLGDLGPYHPSDVKAPVVEALGPGGEAMALVGQYRLFQGRVLTGPLRH